MKNKATQLSATQTEEVAAPVQEAQAQVAKPKRKRSRSKAPIKKEVIVEQALPRLAKVSWLKVQYVKFLIWLSK